MSNTLVPSKAGYYATRVDFRESVKGAGSCLFSDPQFYTEHAIMKYQIYVADVLRRRNEGSVLVIGQGEDRVFISADVIANVHVYRSEPDQQ